MRSLGPNCFARLAETDRLGRTRKENETPTRIIDGAEGSKQKKQPTTNLMKEFPAY